jgi:DNA-binding CsgD family transcriptional regulator
VLVGRETEENRIESLLEAARAGHGCALILRGEAGIGKTALLEQAVERAEGFRLLHALGVESEAELPFAALDELVRPALSLLDELPPPQAAALRSALALDSARGVDRFSSYAATLSLLATAAVERPLLCTIDDAHWLDQASAEAFVFTARRIAKEAIVLLFGVRDPAAATFAGPGISEIRLEGLQPSDARSLVATSAPSLAPAAVERVLEIANGNPLALLEFAATVAQADGGEEFDEPLRVGGNVERSFVERSSRLSEDARRVLVFAAAGDPADSDAVWAALEAAGISSEAVMEAQRHGLLAAGSRLDFCHPLARSAVYNVAPPASRRAVHAALAATASHPDRRAWHRAAASTGPDEEVAASLEVAASAAARRGGVSAEARALERSACLTPDPERRAARLFKAALASESAGRLEHADQLLEETAELTSDVDLHVDAVARRSYLLFDRGEFDRAFKLATAEVDGATPAAAARSLTASGVIHTLVHRLEIPTALELTERVATEAGVAMHDDLDLCHMLAWTRELSGRQDEALELALACVERLDTGTVLAIDFATHFLYAEEYERARDLFERIVADQREAGATGNLAYALDGLSRLEVRVGRPASAYTASLESVQLTEPLGNDVALGSSLAWLSLVEAMLGHGDEARGHGGRALEITARRGDRWNEVRARVGLGHDALARGRVDVAVEWLEPAARMLADGGVRHPNMFRVDCDLIEAQVRLGRRAAAQAQLDRLVENAELAGQAWPAAVAARCRAMLADDGDIDDAFGAALAQHEREASAFERARTCLCYGERLRRGRRRRHARDCLHEAVAVFDALGARPWADRTRAELRASGERLRPRGPTAQEQLTPQELQVAVAAAEGLRNKEIAARLFLSPKTVEFHLSRAYRKLDVRSRTELARRLATEPAAAERLPA